MCATPFSRIHGQTALGSIFRTLLGRACLIVVAVTPPAARAAPTANTALPSLITSTSACPQSFDVEHEIFGLAPTWNRGAPTKQVHVQVSDTGAEYTVQIFDPKLRAEKSFFDPARDCKRRARFVAVFVVLTMMPPGIETQATTDNSNNKAETVERNGSAGPIASPLASDAMRDGAASASSEPINSGSLPAPSDSAAITDTSSRLTKLPDKGPATGANVQRVQSTNQVILDGDQAGSTTRLRVNSVARVEGAATFQWTPAVFQSLPMASVGGEVRGLLGRGRLAALVSIGYIMRSTFSAEGINGSMRRVPAVVGAQWRMRFRGVELATELGGALMYERVRGNGFLHAEQDSTLQLGARMGVAVSSAYGRMAPYLATYINAFPLPQELVAAPPGIVGKTPTIDVGIALGGSYAF